jgi:hypothetical protein
MPSWRERDVIITTRPIQELQHVVFLHITQIGDVAMVASMGDVKHHLLTHRVLPATVSVVLKW